MNTSAIKLQNAEQSSSYITTARGQKCFVRITVPEESTKVRGLVLFIHGLGGHCNSPPKVAFGRDLAATGIATVMPDLPGHGYSEGERCYVETHEHYLEDLLQLLDILLIGDDTSESDTAAAAGMASGPTAASADGGDVHPAEALADAAGVPAEDVVPAPGSDHLALTEGQRRRLRALPFFVSGESMGGGLSLLLGLAIKRAGRPLLPRFQGVILLAPAIKAFPPPAPVVFLLRHLVAPFAPTRQIPNFLESVNRPDKAWKTEESRALVKLDGWGMPGGLGYGQNMKYGMGIAMLDMVSFLQSNLGNVDFPFLVLHDPDDAIVSFAGTRMLVADAATPEGGRKREVVEMNEELHDLLCNAYPTVVAKVLDWIDARLLAADDAAAVAGGGI